MDYSYRPIEHSDRTKTENKEDERRELLFSYLSKVYAYDPDFVEDLKGYQVPQMLKLTPAEVRQMIKNSPKKARVGIANLRPSNLKAQGQNLRMKVPSVSRRLWFTAKHIVLRGSMVERLGAWLTLFFPMYLWAKMTPFGEVVRLPIAILTFSALIAVIPIAIYCVIKSADVYHRTDVPVPTAPKVKRPNPLKQAYRDVRGEPVKED